MSTTAGSHDSLTSVPDPVPPLAESVAIERQALALAQELFPGSATIEDLVDPEYPQQKWRVITVFAKGELPDIHARNTAWHRRMIESLGSAGANITICVLPEPK